MRYYAKSADSIQMPYLVASDQGLHCLRTEISMEIAVKMKGSTKTPKTRTGFIQMIRMDKSTGQIRVNM